MSPVYTARSGKKEASSRRNLVSKETSEIISYQMLDLREEYIYIYIIHIPTIKTCPISLSLKELQLVR